MLKKSKGVTPVIATVLLLFIAVAAVGSAAVFLDGTIEQIQSGAESELEREELVRNSDIRIQNGFNDANDNLNLEVRNTGSVTLSINEDSQRVWSMFIDGRPIDNWVASEDSINPTQVVTIDTNEDYPDEDESVEISINAQYETSDSYICFNPGSENC